MASNKQDSPVSQRETLTLPSRLFTANMTLEMTSGKMERDIAFLAYPVKGLEEHKSAMEDCLS